MMEVLIIWKLNRSKILYDNEILYFKNTIQDLVLTAIEGLFVSYKLYENH